MTHRWVVVVGAFMVGCGGRVGTIDEPIPLPYDPPMQPEPEPVPPVGGPSTPPSRPTKPRQPTPTPEPGTPADPITPVTPPVGAKASCLTLFVDDAGTHLAKLAIGGQAGVAPYADLAFDASAVTSLAIHGGSLWTCDGHVLRIGIEDGALKTFDTTCTALGADETAIWIDSPRGLERYDGPLADGPTATFDALGASRFAVRGSVVSAVYDGFDEEQLAETTVRTFDLANGSTEERVLSIHGIPNRGFDVDADGTWLAVFDRRWTGWFESNRFSLQSNPSRGAYRGLVCR